MANSSDVARQILVTTNANVGPNIEVLKVPHTCLHAVSVSPIAPRMSAEPILGSAMAGFARDPLPDDLIFVNFVIEPLLRHSPKRRMAGGA